MTQQKLNPEGTNLKWSTVAQSTPAFTAGSTSNASRRRVSEPKTEVAERNRAPPSSTVILTENPSAPKTSSRSSVDFLSEPQSLGAASSSHRTSFSADWRAVGNPTTPSAAGTGGRSGSGKGSPSLSSLNYNSPISQLPMSLNEAIGLDDPDEVAEIFRRTSISAPPQATPPYVSPPYVPPRQAPPSAMNRTYSLAHIYPEHAAMSTRRPSYTLDVEPDYYLEEEYQHQAVPHPYYGSRHLPPMMHHPYPVMAQMPYPARYAQPMHMRRHSTVALIPDHFSQFDLSGECIPSMDPYEDSELYAGGEPYYPPQSAPPMPRPANRYSTPSPSQPDFIGIDPYSSLQSMPVTDANFQLSSFKGPLYTVEFKAGRSELFYILEIDGKPTLDVKPGDFVIVEADRGEDLGKVTSKVSLERLKKLLSAVDDEKKDIEPEISAVLASSKEIVPKRIHRKGNPNDLKLLQAKAQEEAIAMVRCQSRVRQKMLPMEVIDAEYQW